MCFRGFLVPDVTSTSYARKCTTQEQPIRRPVIRKTVVVNQLTFFVKLSSRQRNLVPEFLIWISIELNMFFQGIEGASTLHILEIKVNKKQSKSNFFFLN